MEYITYFWCSGRGRGGRHMVWALWAHLEQFILSCHEGAGICPSLPDEHPGQTPTMTKRIFA